MTVTDADRARLAKQVHDSIAAFAAMCAEDEPDLNGARFDYQIDIHKADGGTYPLVHKTD